MNQPEQCIQGFCEAKRGAEVALSHLNRGSLSLSQPIWMRDKKHWKFLIYVVGAVDAVGSLEVSPKGKVCSMTAGDLLNNNIEQGRH